MFKRNKFKQVNGNLILYPDYGNIKGFTIIGVLCLLFCYALYNTNAKYNNIGTINLYYIFAGTILFLLIGMATAYKKVIINSTKQKIEVSFFGFIIKEIPFNKILSVEERSGSLIPAFYIILKTNHIGSSIRVSPTYSEKQFYEKAAFYNQILPLIRELLATYSSIDEPGIKLPVTFRYFKKTAPHIYRYRSVSKLIFSICNLIFSLGCLAFAVLVFVMMQTWTLIFVGILFLVAGLFLLFFAYANSAVLYVNTQSRLLAQKRFGTVQEFPFSAIEKIIVRDTQLNGISIYTSLIISTKEDEQTIDKSFSTQQLSNVDNELRALLIMEN
ncbi:hypothetical protein [Pedobacter punctiformis]|uniref:DUF304 domain-containing protein n=1 Tax=Pedobacter punctiformis TaxID=3004097 RepID=A0ABT4L8U1_9SPHI|nr:hypothetical protein [Pedobacter sp. HCMS5-2]MCZ4244127.1 hypothetical protein [Pedobacter sp. HCMS5-2]